MQEFQANVLESYGAVGKEIEELSVYNQNVFDHSKLRSLWQFPLESEPYVEVWSEYLHASQKIGVFASLKNALVQLHFPIQEGISRTEAYRTATLKGFNPNAIPEATGLKLQQPEKLDLQIYPSLAGLIPVLLPGNREDFVTLVQALTKRNEPLPIPDSMGACMVAGYNNWDRIRRYRQGLSPEFKSGACTPRQRGEQENQSNFTEIAWKEEFKRLIPQKHLYQDRFIILSNGFYSNVAPEDMELTEAQWRDLSITIRLEHESTHYFTRRLFNSMQNNLLDELIADYRGIVAAVGNYRADWFLRFMGLESFPDYRASGRLANYRGQPTLSDGAFKILQALVVTAAKNLEHFDRQYTEELKLQQNQSLLLIALTHFTLEELASDEALARLQATFENLQS